VTTATKPAWWNALHDRAFATLRTDWQRFVDLRLTLHRTERSIVAFDDLVVAGVADRRYESLVTASGQPRGQQIYFRLRRSPP
jgi:hypothetical protein